MRLVRLGDGATPRTSGAAVTVGNFDGVHRGHQALVAAVVARARRSSGTAVVLTFDPHPARVLARDRAPAALTTPDQKHELLAALGVEVLVLLPFTTELAALAPEEFVDRVLVRALQARHVAVGEGFRFGRGRSGDGALLARLGVELGFTFEALPPVLDGERPVSSSRVRDALAAGDVTSAERLLGRTYFVDARVVRGDGRGRTIGVPTANLESANEILPARGVYAGRLRLPEGSWHPAVVNRGLRPTFGGETETLEAHLLDFDGELYGAEVRLSFVARLREERRFPGQQALVSQIAEDVRQARALVSTTGGERV
jgi:riboflavin kinase/FMN adenylyltransferase